MHITMSHIIIIKAYVREDFSVNNNCCELRIIVTYFFPCYHLQLLKITPNSVF